MQPPFRFLQGGILPWATIGAAIGVCDYNSNTSLVLFFIGFILVGLDLWGIYKK